MPAPSSMRRSSPGRWPVSRTRRGGSRSRPPSPTPWKTCAAFTNRFDRGEESMERRKFLKTGALAGLGVAAGLSFANRAVAAGELRLLTWEGYAEDAWVKDFEQANGVGVTKTYVGSNDEYMAKLAAGGGDYDLV